MKLRTWLVIGAVAFALLKAAKPNWYEDLMLRGYAKDQVPPPKPTDPSQLHTYEVVSLVAAAAGLPIGWIFEIAQKVKLEDLPVIAQRISAKVRSMGPPTSTTDEALAAYKKKAMAAGGV
mgnify:CR=1 FL=1